MKNLENRIIDDYISEGIIAIDEQGTILRYNTVAKKIFGLMGEYDFTHKVGRIEADDLVIIADTGVGADDGNLDDNVLQMYGIKEKKCSGKGLLYIGRKGRPHAYKLLEDGQKKGKIELKENLDGISIACRVDYEQRITEIEVDGRIFPVSYLIDISNLVLIRKRQIIFYQTKGYSTKHEALNDILQGRPFMAKEGKYDLSVEGKNIFDFHTRTQAMEDLMSVASGEADSVEINPLISINGYFVMGHIKPLDEEGKRKGAMLIIEDISTLIRSQQERDEALNELVKMKQITTRDFFPEICGYSHPILETKRLAAKAANSDVNVMILGESGTGKSFIARKIHERSMRADRPFVEINCSSIPSELIESELFGYAPGAFTSANTNGKKGLFEMADGGTVFMDEIGDIPLNIQSKLLLFIQNRKFYKVGGNEEISVDVRIITATNKDIETEVREKRFREDLYYRFQVLPIYVEPLRNRKEDIGILIDQIMEAQNKGTPETKSLSTAVRRILMQYDYPGNIREMENVIKRAFVLSDGNIIYPEHLMLDKISGHNDPSEKGKEKSLSELLQQYERQVICNRLQENKYDHISTYRSLRICKTSFYDKLKKYRIRDI